MELVQALKNIGFTQQEAIIYITLCKYGELTGYEASKISGISRSNVYATLASLVEKGRAYTIESSATKYVATPKKELICNIQRSFEDNIKYLEKNLNFEPIDT